MKLFVAPATAFSIGELAGVDILFSEVRDESLHCEFKDLVTRTNEFKDVVIHLNVMHQFSKSIPFQKLRLLHPSGKTGFDTPTISDQIINAFFGGSYLATDAGQLFSYDDWKKSASSDLMGFFEKRDGFPIMVTYYKPDAQLKTYLHRNSSAENDAVAILKVLLGSIKYCESALLWSWAYGLNPVLLSVNPEKFLDSLRSLIGANELAIVKVEAEDKLPEW